MEVLLKLGFAFVTVGFPISVFCVLVMELIRDRREQRREYAERARRLARYLDIGRGQR